MASLETLRRRVLIRLKDFEQKRVLEADHYLNLAQDQFLLDSQSLRILSVIDTVANQLTYRVVPAAGLKVSEIVRVDFYNGGRDYPLEHITLEELDDYYPGWRTNAGGATPFHYMRNIDPTNPGFQSNEIMTIFPWPNVGQAQALRVYYAAYTDHALNNDNDQTRVPKWDEALEKFAAAEMGHPDRADYYARFELLKAEARAEAERGFDDQPKRVRPWRETNPWYGRGSRFRR